jgi:predicted NBD/HSP70 family sugar kinase
MTVLARGSRGARSADLRRRNLSSLLTYVHVHGPTARSRLTSDLGLNRSTIGDLTGELVAAGLVREEPGRTVRAGTVVASSGGRPSYVVVPESDRVQVLAIDIGVTHLMVARIGLGGAVLSRRHRSYHHGVRSERAMRTAITKFAAALLAETSRDTVVVGVGVAVPGMVRRRDGQVRQAPNLGWQDAPVGAELAEALGLPVAVGNDADLGILAEHVRGAAADVDDAVYLSGHAGIGAGVFTSGRPLVGHNGYAGEVGHIVVNPGGRQCHCGSRGCWETESGEERLFELAGRPPGGGIEGVREIVAAAATGDDVAAKALNQVAGWLGTGVASVVNVFNPEAIIMGGALGEIFAAAETALRDAVHEAVLGPPLEQLRLLQPAFGFDSSLIGAAELAFTPLLADPLLEMSAS